MAHQIKFFYATVLGIDYAGALEGLQTAINRFLACPIQYVDMKVSLEPGSIVVTVVYKDPLGEL